MNMTYSHKLMDIIIGQLKVKPAKEQCMVHGD